MVVVYLYVSGDLWKHDAWCDIMPINPSPLPGSVNELPKRRYYQSCLLYMKHPRISQNKTTTQSDHNTENMPSSVSQQKLQQLYFVFLHNDNKDFLFF